MIQSTLNRAENGMELTRQEILALLSIQNGSREYYRLLGIANRRSRKRFDGKGYLFAQLGIEASPCPANCAFCSLSEDSFDPNNRFLLPVEEAVRLVDEALEHGVDEIFLMTTASYDREEFLRYAAQVRPHIPAGVRFVANVGDFDLAYAQKLKETGFTGVYHICRLGEGRDTRIDPATRIETLNAVRDAGLELYYCVEPIGPEHTPEEIAEEILRARRYPVAVMAVMKRICVPGTRLGDRGEISAAELAKICAVTTLGVDAVRAMGVHEPDELCLMAGANQIYAEVSVNPRDRNLHTEEGRGASVEQVMQMLRATEWEHSGPGRVQG